MSPRCWPPSGAAIRASSCVSIGNSSDVQRALLDYETEVAVLAHIDPDERLLIPYRRHPIVVFARKDHRLAAAARSSLRDLDGERMIVREQVSTTRRNFEAHRSRGVTPDVFMEIGSREAIREAVIRGLGISYVSEAEFVPDPSLVQDHVQPRTIYTYAHLGMLEKRRNSRIIRAFLECAADWIRRFLYAQQSSLDRNRSRAVSPSRGLSEGGGRDRVGDSRPFRQEYLESPRAHRACAPDKVADAADAERVRDRELARIDHVAALFQPIVERLELESAGRPACGT